MNYCFFFGNLTLTKVLLREKGMSGLILVSERTTVDFVKNPLVNLVISIFISGVIQEQNLINALLVEDHSLGGTLYSDIL